MSYMNIKSKALAINDKLKELYPDTKIALNYSNTWELLVAVILSAQCTDKRVNIVTDKLFKKYKTLEDYIKVCQEDFEKDIYSTGFYRNKTKNILATAKIIHERFNGEVPATMDELLTLPGVARKTANVILSEAFGKDEGVVVDTHVRRLSNQMGLTKSQNPVIIENDLIKLIPQQDWRTFSSALVNYGRDYCPAKKHDHKKCPLKKFDIKAN